MKEKFFGVLQRVGRSFMLPIAILPVAGLLLGLGSSFTNETTLATYNLLGLMGPGTVPYFIFSVLSKCGGVIFDNLPLIFAIGVAIGMARQEKEVAALAAAVSFLVMHSSISAMISLTGGVENLLEGSTATVLGITSLQMGAFGGIIVGLGVAALHNRFYKIQLPQVLSFFGGTRFVPIISTLVFALVGILMFFVWQPIQEGINALGMVVYSSGYFGTFLFGMIKRLLIPFGLLGLGIIYGVKPFLFGLFAMIPQTAMDILCGVLTAIILTDAVISTTVLGKIRHTAELTGGDDTETITRSVRDALLRQGAMSLSGTLQSRVCREFGAEFSRF